MADDAATKPLTKKQIFICLLVVAAVIYGMFDFTSCTSTSSTQPANHTISQTLQYLRTVDGICRVDVVGNDVYISFANNKLPADYKLIANAASMNGSRALVEAGKTPSRCSVWVIPAGQPATADNAYYSSTARKGKAE